MELIHYNPRETRTEGSGGSQSDRKGTMCTGRVICVSRLDGSPSLLIGRHRSYGSMWRCESSRHGIVFEMLQAKQLKLNDMKDVSRGS